MYIEHLKIEFEGRALGTKNPLKRLTVTRICPRKHYQGRWESATARLTREFQDVYIKRIKFIK